MSPRRFAVVLASAFVAIACNAIVGVEDVTLAASGQGGGDTDADVEDGDVPPVDAAGIPKPSVELALGFNHSCARKLNGRVLCWGDNGAGQLGDGIPFGPDRPSALVPQDVVGLTDAAALASGLTHTCAVKSGGSIVCWGSGSFGELGDSLKLRSSTPVGVFGVAGASSVAAGDSFTCAILAGGAVSCWGANYSGQLGDGTKTDRPTAVPVPGLTNVTSIAAAQHHACAVVAGVVSCWGKNDDGQLGNGTTKESLTPSPVKALTDVVQVAAASRFTCARLRSGRVSCWGANELGQLGKGSPNPAPNPSPSLTSIVDAIAIWVGYEHACAVRANGSVVCWGSAGDGQIGSGTVPADAVLPNPTEVIGLRDALGVSTGGSHSCASTRDGRVACWGQNSLGQVGNGTIERAYTAVAIGGFP